MANEITITPNRPDGLTDMQARVAEGVVLYGLDKQSAINEAGYASLSAGYAALRTPKVIEYIQQLIREYLTGSAIKAIHQVDHLITNARSEYVRLEAARDILDRAGFKPVEKHAHLHGGQVSVKIDLS